MDELNALLSQQEKLVERARAQAGDLAHGLKTSLQLLLLEADRLRDTEHAQSELIREQAIRMQTLIEHQLVRARAQSSVQARGPGAAVRASVEALLRVLGPLAAERGIGHRDRGAAGRGASPARLPISRKCWATCSTTRASGREVVCVSRCACNARRSS